MKSLVSILAPYAQTWDVVKRFAKEFFWPLVIAVIWTYWSWSEAPANYDVMGKGILNFFAAGWVFQQWNRIKKQKRTEDGLFSIETRVKQLVSNLDESTKRMIGYSTGGNSFCELTSTPLTPIFRNQFALSHHGDFPLYDVKVRIVDIERLEFAGSPANDENELEFPVLIPNHLTTLSIKSFPTPRHDKVCHLNVFVTARNGSTVQMFQMTVVDGLLRTASVIEREEKIIFEAAADNYPKGDDGIVDWGQNCENPKLNFKRI